MLAQRDEEADQGRRKRSLTPGVPELCTISSVRESFERHRPGRTLTCRESVAGQKPPSGRLRLVHGQAPDPWHWHGRAVKIDKPDDTNFVLGQTYFIKSVEDKGAK